MASKVKVTQVRSSIRRPDRQEKTLKALGLGRIGKSAVHKPSPSFQGMLEAVSHLVKAEDVS